MPIKIFAAIVAVALLLAFLSPVVFKLKDVALGVTILVGVAMMLVDLVQSFKSEED